MNGVVSDSVLNKGYEPYSSMSVRYVVTISEINRINLFLSSNLVQ